MAERRRAKRGNGEGAIWQEGKYHAGRITIDGQRYQFRAKTGEAVAAKLFTVKQQAAAGTLCDTRRKWKVGEWLEEWLSGVYVEPQTLDGYRRHVRTYLIPAFGHLPLAALGTQQIRAFCQQKMAPRDQGGAGLHQTTVSNIGRTLRIALGAAVDLNLIAKNPAAVRRTIPTPAPSWCCPASPTPTRCSGWRHWWASTGYSRCHAAPPRPASSVLRPGERTAARPRFRV
jgi:hypothetical protein